MIDDKYCEKLADMGIELSVMCLENSDNIDFFEDLEKISNEVARVLWRYWPKRCEHVDKKMNYDSKKSFKLE